MDLFLDQRLTFEKLGMEARLSEDANDWPQQILDELYRQAPYTSDYAPRVVLRDVDSDRRYGLGQIELLNKMAINPRDDDTPTVAKGRQKALVPIVIQDGRMKPLDLMLYDGKVEPLTDERLRKALFRPNLFEAIRERPGDMSLIEQLYPPHRQYGGARGPLMADIGASGVSKEGSVRADTLLDAILPTIKKAQVDELADRLSGDPSLTAALMSNSATYGYLNKLANANLECEKPGHYLAKVASAIIPDVIQIQKLGSSGFRVKTANSSMLMPQSQDVSRPDAIQAFGPDMVSKVESDGTQTITTQPAVKQTMGDMRIEVAAEFGLYKVKKLDDGRQLVGWVFPRVMDLDGTVLPLSVFSNGSEAATQEHIAGIPLGREVDVIDTEPMGTGCFYYASPDGAQALLPTTVHAEVQTPQGMGYQCETILGQQVKLVKVPGLLMVTPIDDATFGIPQECRFIPVENPIGLASSPDDFIKMAEASSLANAIRVITDGVSYTFQGNTLDKLAGVLDTAFLSKDDAVFLGAVLGAQPESFVRDLASMRKQGSQEMWFSARPCHTLKDQYGQAKVAAAAFLEKLPYVRADLIKEAAPIEDPMAVDKILSVGFINPENVSIFAGYIPEFESTIRKLSEVLMAVRMGLHSVDEGALQRSIVHLDKVVAGLKSIGSLPQA